MLLLSLFSSSITVVTMGTRIVVIITTIIIVITIIISLAIIPLMMNNISGKNKNHRCHYDRHR